MATVAPTTAYPSLGDGSLILYTWALTTANADGAPVSAAEWADRTWQASGTWGGASLALQGSNDGVNWAVLSNASGGADIAMTTNDLASTVELPLWVRPNLTTPGVGATIAVTLLVRRSTPMRT